MRASLALCLIACMLGLAGLSGCSLTKKSKSTASGGTGQPFLGTPSESPAPEDNKPTFVSKQGGKPGRGVLAGEVKDVQGRRVADATIKVVEEPAGEAAPVSVTTDRGGYFYVSGLDVGSSYRLVARKRDGNRYLVGTVKARCTNTNMLIPLAHEEPAGGSEKANEKTGGKDEKMGTPASLGVPHVGANEPASATQREEVPPPPPVQTPEAPPDQKKEPAEKHEAPAQPPQPPQPLPPPQGPVPQLPRGTGLENFAKGKNKDFKQAPPSVSIPGRGQTNKPLTPYAPPAAPMSDGGLKPSTAPSAAAGPDERPAAKEESLPSARVVVPSCVRVGRRVENFTLYDYDGKVWELKKKRRGKLMLLVFWHSKCVPCKHAIPYLNRLNAYYRDYGLDVVSIAHESGTPVEKQDAVRPIRPKITYPILFTGGGDRTGDCPVMRQFEIQGYPAVYVLDASGRIVWQGNNLAPRTEYDLEMFIRGQLGIR